MTARDDGGPAFACAAENGHQPGMTLRDHFAGLALQGLLHTHGDTPIPKGQTFAHVRANYAELAYQWADAMIAERNKP